LHMSKQIGSPKVAQTSKNAHGWDLAISDAETMIQESQERIKRLRRAIQTFESLRERGEPFPSKGHPSALPHKSDLPQKFTSCLKSPVGNLPE
jgi:hypothetical protein